MTKEKCDMNYDTRRTSLMIFLKNINTAKVQFIELQYHSRKILHDRVFPLHDYVVYHSFTK